MRRRTRMERNHIPHLTRIKSLPTNMGDLNYERNGTRKKTKP